MQKTSSHPLKLYRSPLVQPRTSPLTVILPLRLPLRPHILKFHRTGSYNNRSRKFRVFNKQIAPTFSTEVTLDDHVSSVGTAVIIHLERRCRGDDVELLQISSANLRLFSAPHMAGRDEIDGGDSGLLTEIS